MHNEAELWLNYELFLIYRSCNSSPMMKWITNWSFAHETNVRLYFLRTDVLHLLQWEHIACMGMHKIILTGNKSITSNLNLNTFINIFPIYKKKIINPMIFLCARCIL